MPISGKAAIKILQNNGFTLIRQRGSHAVVSKPSGNGKITAIVPVHKELAKGTIKSIALQSKLDKKEFGL